MIYESYFPGMQSFLGKVLDENKSDSKKFTDIFSATLNLYELSLQIFIGLTVKIYEFDLTTNYELNQKRAKPIIETLRLRYVAPSLGTLTALAKSSIHFIKEDAPSELLYMKDALNSAIKLGPLATYMTDLNKLFNSLEDHDDANTKIIIHPTTKRSLFSIINDFVTYRNDSSHLVAIGKIIEENNDILNIDLEQWRKGLLYLLELLKPFLALNYRQKKLGKVYVENGIKMISVSNLDYVGDKINESEESLKLEDFYESEWNEKVQIKLGDSANLVLDIFPFLIIRDGKIFFYKKTKASGYQYFSILDDRTFTEKTKKKFSKSVFNISWKTNSQEIFWTEFSPVLNSENSIKANIPSQGNLKFVGRKKQIARIREEILEIPNQNGILYGPGGVGKTALLIQITKQLFEDTNEENKVCDNIIWVSAKSNFYSWEQNATISNPQQFNSLENILQIILRFFDYEDVDEYNSEELKNLVYEILEENTTLLLLDNFETISKTETDKILNYFGSDVKKRLKRLPNNFKVIITSRELIPSGYYQIKLEGLDFRETKLLIDSIYERYRNSHPQLSPEQYKLIHEATSGIPIVIKHCLGQLFEFQVPLSTILSALSEASNEVIKFSYDEIISQLKKDECYLRIMLVLEILNEPTPARVISLVLDREIKEINKHIPILLNYQCVEKINVGIEEKYRISNQISLLAKSLTKEYKEISNDIRINIGEKLTFEKKMDYAIEELEIIEIFHSYIEDKDLAYAEFFLQGELKKRPHSHLLRYHSALFLRDKKKDYLQAIQILETLDRDINKTGKRDPNVLLALASTYLNLTPANYEKAYSICKELLIFSELPNLKMFVAEFYINWSNFLKGKREFDPIDDIKRKNKIKELAKTAIQIIEETDRQHTNHNSHYLISIGYFNQWDIIKAKENINKAINLVQNDLVSLRKYEKFSSIIEKF